jgi:hypothetical protein
VCLPCGDGNPLCLQAFGPLFSILHYRLGLGCALLPHPKLLPGEHTRRAKPWPARHSCSGGEAGILLLVGQRRAVATGGGGQSRPAIPLFRCSRVFRLDPQAALLHAARQNVIHPPAATAAADRSITTFPEGVAEGAFAAPGSPPLGGRLRLADLCGSTRGCLHHGQYVVHYHQPAALAPCCPADNPLVHSVPANVFILLYQASCCNSFLPEKGTLDASFYCLPGRVVGRVTPCGPWVLQEAPVGVASLA